MTDEQIRTETERTRAQAARIRAEEKKLLAETRQLEHADNTPWYRRASILKPLLAGIVAAGLLTVWATAYFQPILTKQLEIERLENRRLQIVARHTTDSARIAVASAMSFTDNVRLQVTHLWAMLDSSSSEWSQLANRSDIPEEARESYLEVTRQTDSTTSAWQHDDFLYGVARVKLEAYERNASRSAFELPDTITSVLHEFPDSSDTKLQELRLDYARTVITILDGPVDHQAAIAIWLAGVNRYNRSREFINDARANASEHLARISHTVTAEGRSGSVGAEFLPREQVEQEQAALRPCFREARVAGTAA